MPLGGAYNPELVFLSVLIAIFSSYTALNLLTQFNTEKTSQISANRIGSSGVVLGIGIWSMHFVGMLAFSLPVPIHYDAMLTLLSLLIAIIATITGLAIANHRKKTVWLLSGGLLLGLGISSMHYLGMAAMITPALMHHNDLIIFVSVLIGIVAANSALWLSFAVARAKISGTFQVKAASAFIMGFAISGMHYTGMAAMSFHAHNSSNTLSHGMNLDSNIVGVALSISILLILAFALWSSRLVAESKIILENEEKIRVITENISDIIITINNQGIINFANHAITKVFGYHPDDVIGKNVSILMPEPLKQNHDQFIQNYLTSNIPKIIGQNQRELEAIHKNGDRFPIDLSVSETRISGQQAFIGTIRDISERIQSQEQLQFLAHHDVLTGLPNRHSFLEYVDSSLEQAKRRQLFMAVMFLDLDRFKVINDTLGHNIGDRLLQEIANRLKKCIRASDIIARISGDEFTILLNDISDINDIVPIAQKVNKEISLPFTYLGHELFSSVSIGISTYPDDGKTASGMLRHADIAMYRSKSEGGNQFSFYSTDMKTKSSHRLKLETDLRHALDRNEFELYYQPQVDIESGVYSGVEALLRWNHPKLGLLPPVDFIPILEETGLIIPVGFWIIETACQQAISWQQQGLPPLHVAVNLSARQFTENYLAEEIARILKNTGLKPEYLELEITENILMHQDSHTMNILHKIYAQGIQLAIDDFGTGYSSLSYLRKFPINTLKIDRSFVRDIAIDSDDAAIVQLIIDMAHSLKLNVLAEGVETREQIEFLKNKKCWEMQGYYFSKPLPADEITSILKQPVKKD